MNKPSERIVVFVTPAQKRAISATADGLGISISELMRRAVIAFSATSDQVKAASIVDRLNAPREPDALAQVLRRAARPLRSGRASPLRAAPAPLADPETGAETDAETGAAADAALLAAGESHGDAVDAGDQHDATLQDADADHANGETLPAALTVDPNPGNAAREIAQAVARLAAETNEAGAGGTALSSASRLEDEAPLQSPGNGASFARATRPHGDADARHDGHNGGAPEDGKFA
ncbi:hypothetical protein [Paraburkholderia ferrariae]|jgi:hypothetical protein|uniref:hypothetical protein n=1 Tax=Paraburkholderia ferrariae TaxID=386056 RepID=UPI0005A7FF7E|nr:hypothetical protein [Paraburkholderia ferrariae]